MSDDVNFEGDDLTMEPADRMALVKCRAKILEDLDVRLIIDFLLETRVVDDKIYEQINSEITQKDKAKRLLDILPRRGPKAFHHFLEALREDYDWLVDDLEEALTAKDSIDAPDGDDEANGILASLNQTDFNDHGFKSFFDFRMKTD